ncbi:DUF3429 domain-containing protein [Stakelama marina]|uniref:DUF3429 domain-containing protein n=1 Tax=Stakelama marina TaxID=2826939 RepID=A0A8T4IEL6_9SPHN|nr:DUF3429 domain-containing protein [Stakelama marina]MBR0552901.1 DUF3429 domain-containing protein [Stakelama marina]
MEHPHRSRIPIDSLVFGYVPMLPFVAAALGVWLLPAPWPAIAVWLVVIWGGLILCFVGGVRRGYGFGNDRASTPAEIATMLVYFCLAGFALFLPWPRLALLVLAAGFVIAAALDTHAARRGNAPAHFAKLRPPQFSIAVVSLLVIALAV